MSTEKKIIPRANFLMGSMRSIGYTFESAIADVIDNSIREKRKNVHLYFPSSPMDNLAVGILDDGEGMGDKTLFEAMRYGSSSSENQRAEDDMGRFGLGMKSASMSMCRILTVASKSRGKISAYTWDYNYIQKQEDWITLKLDNKEIKSLPYIDKLIGEKQGTLVIWRDFDVLSKSSNGQVYDSLNEHKQSVQYAVSLIYHRFLNSKNKDHLSIFINNSEVKGLDPFLESHPKTTTKKEVSFAINDSQGMERYVKVKPFILPFASDLKKKDRDLVGGLDTLKSKQGFYLYRNKRLIIWGTWFGMRPQSELTKNARIRVDIPNSLDDIFKIDVKKQTANIPKLIKNQMKRIVNDALEISVTKQTHRGRREDLGGIEYIWNRMAARGGKYYYQVNRESGLFKMVHDHMSSEGDTYLDILIKEIENNLPIQQIYIDKSNGVVENTEDGTEDKDARKKDILNLGIMMIDTVRRLKTKTTSQAIEDLMKTEPFCNYKNIKDKLTIYYKDEIE
mgnify:FL=1